MATFANKTFNAANYASVRPSYPPKLYNLILGYHHGTLHQGLDLGCGHGIVARQFGHHIKQLLCTDPSEGMLEQARKLTPSSEYPGISYLAAKAEDDMPLASGSVDIVTSAQACHWFDQARLWPRLRDKVRAGGTVALWGYQDHAFPAHPRSNAVMERYVYRERDADKLGPYWESGRDTLRNNLVAIVPPGGDWEDVVRYEYEPARDRGGRGEGTLLMSKRLRVGDVKRYFRTYSAFHGWQRAHEGVRAREEGGEGDVVDRMFDEMAAVDEIMKDEESEVDIEWGSALILARRRA